MRRFAGLCAAALGTVGTIACVVALSLGWLAATRIVGAIDRVVARLDGGLAEIDSRLGRLETRMIEIRAELEDVRGDGEALVSEDPELPRVRVATERLLERLGPALDRAAILADSMRSVAAATRAAADAASEFADDPEKGRRARDAADAIDRAAQVLRVPGEKVDALKEAKAAQFLRRIVDLAREAVASVDLLAQGLAKARTEIHAAREGMAECRNAIVFRAYAAASAASLGLSWAALGQLCLFGWGRKRLANRPPASTPV